MDLKKIKGRAVMSACVALSCLALGASGCGEEDKPKGDGKTDAGGDTETDGGGGTYEASFTLVPVTAVDDSNPVVTSHKVIVLDAASGVPLNPPIETMTAATGKFTLKGLPKDKEISIHVPGVGPATADMQGASTYDSILLNYNRLGGDPLFRISNEGLLTVVPKQTGFVARGDRASAAGSAYWAPGGVRKGGIGCAKICVGGKLATDDFAVRYVKGEEPVPTTLDRQAMTSGGGRFYIGNLPKGAHTVGASLDECKTILGKPAQIFVPFTRDEAKGAVKGMIVQLFIDVDVPANPTSKECEPG